MLDTRIRVGPTLPIVAMLAAAIAQVAHERVRNELTRSERAALRMYVNVSVPVAMMSFTAYRLSRAQRRRRWIRDHTILLCLLAVVAPLPFAALVTVDAFEQQQRLFQNVACFAPLILFAWAVVELYRCLPRPGHCAACGYNLRGNVSAKCPECGSRVDGPSAPT